MKRLIALILILTIFDAACTVSGLRLGVIEEANQMLAAPMSSAPWLTSAAVCVGTAALLALIWRCRQRAPWAGTALIGVAAVKLGVVGLHLHWILSL